MNYQSINQEEILQTLNKIKKHNEKYQERLKKTKRAIKDSDYETYKTFFEERSENSNAGGSIILGDEEGDQLDNQAGEEENIIDITFPENNHVGFGENQIIPLEKIFLTETELSNLFNLCTEGLQYFCDNNELDIQSKLSPIFDDDNSLEESKNDLQIIFLSLLNQLGTYYFSIFDKIIEKNKNTNIFKEVSEKTENQNYNYNYYCDLNKITPFFNVYESDTSQEEKNIKVTSDNHCSSDYFEFLAEKIENINSKKYFCGDVCDRSLFKEFSNEKKSYKRMKDHNKNLLFGATYEKKIFIVDFLKTLLLWTTKIYVHDINPNNHFEVLGNHEEIECLFQNDLGCFFKKIDFSKTQISTPFYLLPILMKMIIPAQILIFNQNTENATVLTHSGGTFELPFTKVTKKLNIEKTNKFYYTLDEMNKWIEEEANNKNLFGKQCHKTNHISLCCTLGLLDKLTTDKNLSDLEKKFTEKRIMCDQIPYEKKGINFTEAIKNNRFLMGYEKETGFKISNPSEFMKINETIFSNAIKTLFHSEVNSITSIFGHHHKLENLALIIAKEHDQPSNDISYFPISDKMHIYFLPPTWHMNQFAIWRQQLKIEEYENNKKNNKSKKNYEKTTTKKPNNDKSEQSMNQNTTSQNYCSQSRWLLKTLGFATGELVILTLFPENKNIINSNMQIQEKLVSFFKENKKYLGLIGVTSIALSYLLWKKDSKKKNSILNKQSIKESMIKN